MITVPKPFVVIGIAFIKFIEAGMYSFKQGMFSVQLQDGFAAVCFKIPQGMIEVEKKMFVFQAM